MLQNAPLLFHACSFALEHDWHFDLQLLVHGDTLQIDMQQRSLDGLVLPVHDHCLGAFAVQIEIENCVVAGLGVENSRDLPWVKAHGFGILASAIDHGRNFSAPSHPAGFILIARFTGLRF